MINTTAFPAVAVTLWTLGAFSVATWGLIVLKGVQLIRSACLLLGRVLCLETAAYR